MLVNTTAKNIQHRKKVRELTWFIRVVSLAPSWIFFSSMLSSFTSLSDGICNRNNYLEIQSKAASHIHNTSTQVFILLNCCTLLEMPMALILADSLPSSFNWCLPSSSSWGISSSSAVGKNTTQKSQRNTARFCSGFQRRLISTDIYPW